MERANFLFVFFSSFIQMTLLLSKRHSCGDAHSENIKALKVYSIFSLFLNIFCIVTHTFSDADNRKRETDKAV